MFNNTEVYDSLTSENSITQEEFSCEMLKLIDNRSYNTLQMLQLLGRKPRKNFNAMCLGCMVEFTGLLRILHFIDGMLKDLLKKFDEYIKWENENAEKNEVVEKNKE